MLPASFLLTALLMGTLSSLHCVGMCGPLVLSSPIAEFMGSSKWVGWIGYHGGRLTTYVLIGILLGVMGRSISIAGWQQGFSIVLGVILLLTFFLGRYRLSLEKVPLLRTMQQGLFRFIAHSMRQPGIGSAWGMGMANGLLPCSMVYMAATGAMAAGSIQGGMVFMTAFGLATTPALLLLSELGVRFRFRINGILGIFTLVVGILLIIRGLNLNIPFLSPYLHKGTSGTAIDCGS
ncbi:MAG: sulfite exporter TauE/SafE family protein [Bacteroidota bacterium]